MSMRLSKPVCLVFTLFALSTAPVLATESGWYLGFSVGQSDINNPEELDALCETAFLLCDGEDKGTAIQGVVGYQVNNYVGVEGTLFDLGDPALSASQPTSITATVSMQGFTLSLLPQVPLGDVGALFARLGLAVGDVEVSASAPAVDISASDSTSAGSILFGVGGAINIGRRATVRVEWMRFAFDETLRLANQDVISPDVDVFAATLVFRFPKNI